MEINQYPVTASEMKDLSFLDIDQYVSAGVYQSQKVPVSLVKAYMLSENIEQILLADMQALALAGDLVSLKNYLIDDGSTLYLVMAAGGVGNQIYQYAIDVTTGLFGTFDLVSGVFTPVAGGSQTLADTLTNGNTSGANDIQFNSAQGIKFDNNSRLREGTTDAGLGGGKGVAQVCSLDYELKWEAGRQYVMEQNGVNIRQSLYNFDIPPTTSDDASLGYQDGSLWILDNGTTYECIDAASGTWVNRGSGYIIEIGSAALADLQTAGTLDLTTIYIVIDAPFRIAMKAEASNKLGANGTIIDFTYSGTVFYDVTTNNYFNGTICDGQGNTWNGAIVASTVLGADCLRNQFYQVTSNTLGDNCEDNTFMQNASSNTLLIGCKKNTFQQESQGNQLGDDCSFNTFGSEVKSTELGNSCSYNIFKQGANRIILGLNCNNNTFGLGAYRFTFGDGLQNVTIEAGITGDDYSDPVDYAFLYSKNYPSTIFRTDSEIYHRWYDIDNDRIVVTNLTTLVETYIGGSGGVYVKDANDNVFFSDAEQSTTTFVGVSVCTNNIFHQNAINNTLGELSRGNTFGQDSYGFTFGVKLRNVTIEANIIGADYSDIIAYDFIYNKNYASTIFQSGGITYHRYYDVATDRIVITLMASPFTVSYIGGGATPDIQQVLDTGNTSTTPIKIDDGAGNYVEVKDSNIIMEDSSGNALTIYPDSITIQNPSFGAGTIKATALANNVFFELPNKAAGTETFAMLSDIGAGSGDMLKSTYDINNNGIVDKAQSMVTKGRNSTGVTLYKGTIIYLNGATGQLPNFVKAQANTEATSAGTFGVVIDDIANNSNGWVNTIGLLEDIDTRTTATHPFTDVTLAVGETIYLHPTIAGYVTNVKPSAPNHIVYIGKVVNVGPATQGAIVYRMQNGYELDEIHNVSASSPANKDGLFYNTSTSLWEARQTSTSDISGLKLPISSVGNGTAVTGTIGITLCKTLSIPANSFTVGDALELYVQTTKTLINGTQFVRVYWNTSASLVGAILIASTGAAAASTLSQALIRHMGIEVAGGGGNGTQIVQPVSGINNPYVQTTSPIVPVAINWTSAGFIIVSIQNGSTLDSSNCNLISLK